MCVHMLRSSRPIDAIYSIMREMADPDTVRFDEARERILAKGYTPNHFDECLDEYERLNVPASKPITNQDDFHMMWY